MFEIKREITTQDCLLHPNKIFLFGDNLQGYGMAGQAIIRNQPNAIGIPTKVSPSMSSDSFFNDTDHYTYTRNLLISIWKMHLKGEVIVVPEFRFGFGLAKIDTYAPEISKLITNFYVEIYKTLAIKFYAGIGSRSTPFAMKEIMVNISRSLESSGHILRSGGAQGADSYFEEGVHLKKDIYLPWKGFNGNNSSLYGLEFNESTLIASENHPAWDSLTPPVKKLMTRNVFQIFGLNMAKPVDFVICWTEDGCESHESRGHLTGGTGLAISIASKNNIPVYNLRNHKSLEFVMNKLAL